MNSYNHRQYKNSKFLTETISPKEHFIKIYYSPRTIKRVLETGGEIFEIVDNFSHVHNTPPYETKKEANAYAEGYVDCLNHFYNCGQTYTDANKDSYIKEQEKGEKQHREDRYGHDVVSLLQKNRKDRYGENVVTTWASMKVLINVLEREYKKGWEDKLSELKNIDGDVGD